MEISVVVFCLLVAGVVIVLLFCSAFFLELIFNKDKKTARSIEKAEELDEELDLDSMLAKLEQKSRIIEQPKAEPVKVEEELDFEEMFARLEETVKKTNQKNQEEPKKDELKLVETKIDDEDEELKALLLQLEEKQEVVKEQPPVIKAVQLKTENAVQVKPEKQEVVLKIVKEEHPCPATIDYDTRLEKLKESLVKLEKDLSKSTKELNKFERTTKRKARNEKLLDRKAGELANLNLLMYNVNDIKDVDPEKKVKQEELISHIAELKDSIKTANEYLQNNKEKNANAKKLNNFLIKERTRYTEEIQEIEAILVSTKNKK